VAAPHFNFLVNNAGIGIHASFEQTTEQQFDTLLNIHLKGTFFLTQALLPLWQTAVASSTSPPASPASPCRVMPPTPP
jgi:NAD(P)-dependent dehydrogenase (short-subunit alcohol dehydrogenase family)